MPLGSRLSKNQTYQAYYRRIQEIIQRPKTRVSGLVSLTLFTVAFFGLLAILPTFKTIAQLKKEIGESQEVRAKLQQKIEALDQAQELYRQVTPELGLINQVVPREVEFERLAWQIEWLAKTNQVQINSGEFGEFAVKDGQKPKTDKAGTIEITLNLISGYPELREFLDGLNKIDRLVSLDQITINSKGSQGSSEQASLLNTNIKAKAYFLPEK
jgi:Tfp pilus assembly protein PilO